MDLDRLNYNANQSKLGNLFLGFFEGLFLDGRVRIQEIEALIKWVEQYPEAVNVPHFDNLYQVLVKAAENPEFSARRFPARTCEPSRLCRSGGRPPILWQVRCSR